MKKLNAFTLSELLVSLSVLGLIAALTLPSIFNSVNSGRDKAVVKETINTLQVLLNQGQMEGMTRGSLGDYVLNNVSAARMCPVGSTGGCYAPIEPTQGAFDLQNNASVFGIERVSTSATSDVFYLDVNGIGGPNTIGTDRIQMIACLDTGCTGTGRAIPGYMQADPASAASVTRYNAMFQ